MQRRLADPKLRLLDALKGGTRVVDARSEAEHTGARAMSRRAGHIPDACHLEWSEFVGPDGRFLDEAGLRAKVEKAGVKPGEPIITHCQSGGRASVDAFVLNASATPRGTTTSGGPTGATSTRRLS